MRASRLTLGEFASLSSTSAPKRVKEEGFSKPSPATSSARNKAGALRSLEGDRGLPKGLVSPPVVTVPDKIGLIFAVSFAFSAFAIGIFFLILSAPYIWQIVKHLVKVLR